MNVHRREVLKAGGGAALYTLLAAAGFLKPGDALAQAWNKNAFEAKTLDEVVKALGGAAPAQSKDIAFVQTPDIAENGAVVPIGMTSRLPGTDTLAVLVEKNPNMLAAVFTLPAGTLPELQTRVKMAQTSNVYVLARAGGRFAYATKEIKVTLGGCGG